MFNLIIIIVIKKNYPIQSTWVGLDPYDGLGWVIFFLIPHGGLG